MSFGIGLIPDVKIKFYPNQFAFDLYFIIRKKKQTGTTLSVGYSYSLSVIPNPT